MKYEAMDKTKREVKLIIFRDDDEKVKDRAAIILEENSIGIKVKLWDREKNKVIDSPAFIIPEHRVLKIKDLEKPLFVDTTSFEALK